MTKEENKFTKEDITGIMRDYMRSGAFTDRKVSDMPIDALSVVNRRYVTLNGTFANRPKGSVIGQRYFATDLATNGMPTWNNGSNWVSATGSILGSSI